MASNDTYIFAENFSANSSESLRLSGFPVTKSVRDLKTEIVRQGGARYSAEDITITFGSQELSDPDKSLADYQIRNGDTVDYLHFTVAELDEAMNSVLGETGKPAVADEETYRQIYFKDMNGVSFALLGVPLNSTVKTLREMLAKDRREEYGDDVATRLLWKKTQLENNQKLEKLGTKQEIEMVPINIVSRVRGG